MRNILYFTADWCNPCKKVKPIVEELNRDSVDTKFQMIDVDQEIDFAKQFNISSIPTFIVMDDSVEVLRISGAQTRGQLESLMNDEF